MNRVTLEDRSYIYGLILSDGNLSLYTRGRGKVSIELQEADYKILESIHEAVPYPSNISYRVRDTNFKKAYGSCLWACHRKELRDWLIAWGFPLKDKDLNANIPTQPHSTKDFWRGYIDGDGSIGFTAEGVPFLSLSTNSRYIKDEFCKLLKEKTGQIRSINRNTRDGAFNIVVKNEEAIILYEYLYKNSNLHLERKYKSGKQMLKWERKVPKISSKPWTTEQDTYILNNPIEDSMEKLKRTKSSIKTRLWRLKTM